MLWTRFNTSFVKLGRVVGSLGELLLLCAVYNLAIFVGQELRLDWCCVASSNE